MALFGRKKTDPAPPQPSWEPLPPPPEPRPDGLRRMEDHRDYLLSCISELPPIQQQLLDVVGLALCEEIVSPISLQSFDNSAMDGYAVRAAEVAEATPDEPVWLPVDGTVPAGQAPPHELRPGTAMKVMTGASLPAGADAVVAYEATDRGAEVVEIYEPSDEGRHIRRAGEDVAAGQRLFAAGDQLSPRSIGLLAAIGRDSVLVRPRPRVVVIATGSELVPPGRQLTSDFQIYDSNSYLLAAAARAAGAQVFRMGFVSDDPAKVKEIVSDQFVRADLIVTSGGVSQGDYDVVKAVLPELGATEFVRVAMQPGKPQGFGLVGTDRIPMIMLPGNPVSSFVSFEAFVRPVIRKLMGLNPILPVATARAAHAMTATSDRRQLARGVVSWDADGERRVSLIGGHGSHLIGDLAQANALVVLPESTDLVGVGEQVEVWLLDDQR